MSSTHIILLLSLLLPSTSSLNLTSLLSSHPQISSFSSLLQSSPIPSDLLNRSSLTLLAVPNSYLRRSSSSISGDISDVLRLHILLEYLSLPDLLLLPPSGRLFTTLLQTTGRAPSNLGSLNLSRNPQTNTISLRSPSSSATLLSLLSSLPYNLSLFTISNLLLPPKPPSIPINISHILLDAGDFNIAANMLAASGVLDELERDEVGAGITVFAPTDEAFAGAEGVRGMTAGGKAAVMRFHVLHSYYPMGSLESIVNPVQPTVATEDFGAGWYTVNISRVNGSVAIDTGVVVGVIVRTVYDRSPVAVFAVSEVLVPREGVGEEEVLVGGVGEEDGVAPEAEMVSDGGLGFGGIGVVMVVVLGLVGRDLGF